MLLLAGCTGGGGGGSAELVSIAVTPTSPSIAKGTTQQFTAIGTFSDSTTQDLTTQTTWKSSDTGKATLNNAGLATSVAVGTTTITAASGSISGSTTLTIATLASIAVTPANPSIVRSATQQFTATGTLSNSATQDLTTQAIWSSSTTTVATISAGGMATPISAGTTTITAVSGSLSGNTTLTVQGVNLPKTGQVTSYDTGTIDDGALQKGAAWPNPRFTDNGNNTVTDNLTGLMWAGDPTLSVLCSSATTTNWQGALDYVACLNTNNYLGHNDWRLPNIIELESLIDSSTVSPVLPAGHPFTNVQNSNYWTSTTSAADPSRAWLVHMQYGFVSYAPVKTSDLLYVWPVRDAGITGTISLPMTGQTTSYSTGDDGDLRKGVAWPSQRFTGNGDNTVTDNLTGLIWLKDANCMATKYPSFDADGGVTWQQALDFVAGINNGTYPDCGGGHTDWRLPNRKELESLLDKSNYMSALPAGHPFTAVQDIYNYWSSTSYAGDTANYAWAVRMLGGNISYDNKVGPDYVWPVRSGQ